MKSRSVAWSTQNSSPKLVCWFLSLKKVINPVTTSCLRSLSTADSPFILFSLYFQEEICLNFERSFFPSPSLSVHPLTAIISLCYPNPCSDYVVSSSLVGPSFKKITLLGKPIITFTVIINLLPNKSKFKWTTGHLNNIPLLRNVLEKKDD